MTDPESAVVEAAKRYVAAYEAANDRMIRKPSESPREWTAAMLRPYAELHEAVTDLANESSADSG